MQISYKHVAIKHLINFIVLAIWFLSQNSNAFHPEKWGCTVGFVDIREFIQKEIQNYKNIQNCDRDLMQNKLIIKKSQEGVFTLQNPFYQVSRENGFVGKGSQQKQHGTGPLLVKLLKNNSLTVDWKLADIVFVYDFCIKFPTDQSRDRNYSKILLTGYQRLMSTKKWKEFGGKNFLFIVSHPLEKYAENDRCNKKKTANAIYAFTEWVLACGIRTHNILIPYLTNDIIKDDKKFQQREKLMCFVGNTRFDGNPGIRLRYYMQKYLQNSTDALFIRPGSSTRISHLEIMQTYQNCKYCFVVSGDTLSSRRLGEVILGGCIPVFVGPPFHNIWFEQFIHYDDLSIFLYIKNREWDFHPERRIGNDKGWKNFPERIEFVVPGEANMYELKNITEIEIFLRNFPQHKAIKKHNSVLYYQSAFEYSPNPHGYPSAFDLLMRHSCKVFNRISPTKNHANDVK